MVHQYVMITAKMGNKKPASYWLAGFPTYVKLNLTC